MLVPCRNCGKEVGENAEVCFNCGTKNPNLQRIREGIIGIGLSIILFTLVVKKDDWFDKDSLFVEWFPILLIFLCIVYAIWFVFKTITKFFK